MILGRSHSSPRSRRRKPLSERALVQRGRIAGPGRAGKQLKRVYPNFAITPLNLILRHEMRPESGEKCRGGTFSKKILKPLQF